MFIFILFLTSQHKLQSVKQMKSIEDTSSSLISKNITVLLKYSYNKNNHNGGDNSSETEQNNMKKKHTLNEIQRYTCLIEFLLNVVTT